MKIIILYARRQTGVTALLYLVAKGYKVVVISDDEYLLALAKDLGVERTVLEMIPWMKFDLFLCVHGNKILPKELLIEGKFVNVHPCLFKYKGQNPIKRYILGQDTDATVESHYMVEKVDEGKVICEVGFTTPVCKTYAEFYNIAIGHYILTIKKTLEILGV